MRKFYILFILSFTYLAQAFSPDAKIDQINQMTDKNKIHQKLLILKKANLNYKKKLQKENTYKANQFYYTLTLERLLEKIPVNLKQMPDCSSLYHSLLNDYKTTWNKLSPPTHHIWPAFQKLCQKNKL